MVGLCARSLCAVCHGGAIAELVLWQCGEPARGVVLGANGRPAGHGAPPGGVSHRHGDHGPTPQPLTAEQAVLPLALGADGVMVPFRPDGGGPRGEIRWREVKVGVLARLGQHRTRTDQCVTRLSSAAWWQSWVTLRCSSHVCGSSAPPGHRPGTAGDLAQ